MYKIEYWNPDGKGFSKTEPWVSEPITKGQLNGALEHMKARGCTVVNVIDMGVGISFTQNEIQMVYAACMDYADRLCRIGGNMPSGERGMINRLSDRAREFWNLTAKMSEYMESGHT